MSVCVCIHIKVSVSIWLSLPVSVKPNEWAIEPILTAVEALVLKKFPERGECV